MNLDIDRNLIIEFEKLLDVRNPKKSGIPAKILGYGEISTVFEIETDKKGIAYKRMPLFENHNELNRYVEAFENYSKILEEDIGLSIPPYSHTTVPSEKPPFVFYIGQRKLPEYSFGNKAIHLLSNSDCIGLVRLILRELSKVWKFNAKKTGVEVGIDGQISNWAIEDFAPSNPLANNVRLYYIDTSTPLYRVNGVEQLNAELFLRPGPSFLARILGAIFLDEVVTRYYDFHLVAVDLIANFYKEQKSELIHPLIDMTNEFFSTESKDLDVKPVSMAEIGSYYRRDASIWRVYLSLRKLDRFLRAKILNKGYPYILPEKIRR
ncbi:MAG: DUF6206 family protein [Actinomycetota bacterium]|nr:DUF6206 family protein [Actinomycetota bacterium]